MNEDRIIAPPSAQSLSSSAEDVINRGLDEEDYTEDYYGPERVDIAFADQYEIAKIKNEINAIGAKKVALQFPDGLLKDASKVVNLLRTEAIEIFVLADTSYGSCCVDEVAASHIDPDLIVHLGRACLTQTSSRYRTLYILPKWSLPHEQMQHAAEQLAQVAGSQKSVVFMYDLGFTWAAADMVRMLESRLGRAIGHLEVDLSAPSPKSLKRIHLADSTIFCNETTILWLGGESRSLQNLVLTRSRNEIWSFDPRAKQLKQQSGATKMLARRYVKMQQVRDSSLIGLVMGTLGVQSYLDLVNDLIQYIKDSGRRSHLFVMGKLNPAKMANFAEIESWVLIGCPENTLVESKDFYKPIVTPFECVIALSEDVGHAKQLEWDGSYILDFGEIITLIKQDRSERTIQQVEDDEAHFSIITGKYQARPSTRHQQLSELTGQMTLRDTDRSLARLDDNRYLRDRLFQGLEVQAGTPVATMAEGRSGVAKNYSVDS